MLATLAEAFLKTDLEIPNCKTPVIEAYFGQDATPPPAARSVPSGEKQPFLSSLLLERFRDFPIRRDFEFGTVNLLYGPNGTGKTSLLEAIELLYCGRNKRDPKGNEAYRIRASFADGATENATDHRPALLFRERNLLWYGQSEVKTNNLYQSFSQYNFLNTDAAVSLAESSDNLEEDLTKLLVGPETSKTWREIERTSEKLESKLKELDAIRNQVRLELASVNRRIEASAEDRPASNAVYLQLKEIVERAGWKMPDSDAEESARQLIKILTELETLLRQAVVFDFAGAPITIAKLRSFVREAEEACTKAQSHITRIQELQDEQRALKQDLKRLDKTSTAALTISRFLDVGILNKIAEVERLERVRQAGQRDLCGYDDKFRMHLQSATDITAAAFRSTARSELDSARDSLKTAESSYSKFAEQHDKSTKLLQQLRDVANELLLDASSSDVCPLCHTEFPPGELIKHIRHDVDRALEEKAASLLKEVRTCKERVDASRIMEQIAEWLKQFCQQHGHSDSTALDTIRSEIASTQEALTDADRGLAQIRSELMKLAESGITPELYERFLPQVASALGSKDLVSAKSVTQLRAHLGSEKEEVTSKLNELDETIRDSEQSLEELLTEPPEGTTHGSLVAATRERITMVNGVLERLQSTLHSFPWPTDKPLSDLVVAVKSARNVALQFQSALTEERTETKQLAEASGRKEQIEKQLAGLEPRIERLREAQGVLLRIRNEHSLNSAMENALRQNRIAIETIFGRIHSPAEFSGLGDSLTTLIREAGGTLANLHQISTGQRAAFALSLFLAQNSQLRTAPPIMLIDDPIAHVDDLNCLSFLDFLRELVVMGDRQIVFSTANDKLATLFARKFEFLGDEEFRRFSLTR